MHMRNVFLCIFCILLLAIATGAPLRASPKESPPITLTFWTIRLSPTYGDPDAIAPDDPRCQNQRSRPRNCDLWGFMNELLRNFERQNPGVKITWIDKPCFDFGCDSIVLTFRDDLRAGIAPDVINTNTFIALRLAALGEILPIPRQYATRYESRFWELTEYQGHIFAFPWYVGPNVLIYNAKLFEDAGLNPDLAPRTQQELFATAKIIRERMRNLGRYEVYGFWPNIDGLRLLTRFAEEGLPIWRKGAKGVVEALFNQAGHVSLLQKYRELYEQDYFPADVFSLGFDGAVDKFAKGELAMLLIGPQFLTRIKNQNPAIMRQIRIAPYPVAAGNLVEAPVMSIALTNHPVSNRDPAKVLAAERFAAFITNGPNQMAFARYINPFDNTPTVVFPSAKLTPTDERFFTQSRGDPFAEARRIGYQALLRGKDFTPILKPIILHKNYVRFLELFSWMVTDGALISRTRSPRQALDTIVKEWNKILSRP